MTTENPWKEDDTVWVAYPYEDEPERGFVVEIKADGVGEFRVPILVGSVNRTLWLVPSWLHRTQEAAEMAIAERKVQEAQASFDEWATVMAHYQRVLDEAMAHLEACKAKLPK